MKKLFILFIHSITWYIFLRIKQGLFHIGDTHTIYTLFYILNKKYLYVFLFVFFDGPVINSWDSLYRPQRLHYPSI